MKKSIISFSFLIYLMNVSAQETSLKSFFASEISNQLPASAIEELRKVFIQYQIYSLDVNAIHNFMEKNGSLSRVNINFGNKYVWQLNIALHDIRSADYSMQESTPGGVVTHPKGPAFTYKGFNGNNPKDLVYLSILPDYISGFVQQNGKNYFIEPAKEFDRNVPNYVFVVYQATDVILDSTRSCGISDYQQAIGTIETAVKEFLGAPENVDCKSAEVAIAATNDFVTKYGGASATQNKIITQLNIVSGLFGQSALDIKYTLTTFYAAKSNEIIPDNEKEITKCLSDFRTWANGGGFNVTYDDATLWVGRDLSLNGGAVGGYAYGGQGAGSGVICGSNRYNCVEDKGSNQLNGVLQTHEIGHNWGAAHQNCTNCIMNPVVNPSSNIWTSTCVSTITGTKNSSSCLSPCITTGIKDIVQNDGVWVYPNPFHAKFTLEISPIIELANAMMKIYDLCGKEVRNISLDNHETSISVENLRTGIYFYQVINSKENIANGKLAIQ